jgi:hypothetical protein
VVFSAKFNKKVKIPIAAIGRKDERGYAELHEVKFKRKEAKALKKIECPRKFKNRCLSSNFKII